MKLSIKLGIFKIHTIVFLFIIGIFLICSGFCIISKYASDAAVNTKSIAELIRMKQTINNLFAVENAMTAGTQPQADTVGDANSIKALSALNDRIEKLYNGNQKISVVFEKIKSLSGKLPDGADNAAAGTGNETASTISELIKEIEKLEIIICESAESGIGKISIYYILINGVAVIILVFIFAAAGLYIRKHSYAVKEIANKIFISQNIQATDNRIPGVPDAAPESPGSVEITDLIKKTGNTVATYYEVITGIENSISKLLKSSDSNSEVLNFLSEKADEHSAASEKDLASVKNISEMTTEIMEVADEQHVSMGLLVLRMLDFTRIIESISLELTSQINGMEDISQKFAEGNTYLKYMSESMSRINESSAKMSKSLQFITDVSDRINLLALNAAIESARAGEQGRGFAVVSDEISKLADQTALSIKDINTLIKTNENDIRNGLLNMEKTVQTIHSAVDGVVSIKEKMHTAFGRMDFQIKNNYIVSEESEKVKNGTSVINNAITKQKEAIDSLVVSINSIKEMSAYFSYLTKQIVNHSSEVFEWIAAIKKTVKV